MLCSISQRSLDEIITPLSRRNDVATSFRRNNDVIIASCAYRDILLQLLLTYCLWKIRLWVKLCSSQQIWLQNTIVKLWCLNPILQQPQCPKCSTFLTLGCVAFLSKTGFVALCGLNYDDVTKWDHFPHYWPFVNSPVTGEFPTKASDAELWSASK